MQEPNTHPPRVDRLAAPWLLFTLVLAFFLVSGACGLLYQVVWTRKLVLLFGATAYAVGTVLSLFFLGLGLGSLWGGRVADRNPRPLYLYGLFEILIGLWAIGFLGALLYGEALLAGWLAAVHGSRALGLALRAILAALLILPPVFLMGATLPLLAKFVNRSRGVHGLRIGTLYTLNTAGAILGCFVTGFFLIAHFGYFYTTLIGAAANILVGLGALYFGRSPLPEPEAGSAQPETPGAQAPRPGKRAAALLAAAFAVAGFAFLALEVIWTRLLAIVFLGTTYAYTTMLTTLLCGIAAGSVAAALLADRVRDPMAAAGAAFAAAGIAAVWMLAGFAAMPEALLEWQRAGSASGIWERTVRAAFALSFGVLFPPAFFSGLAFPFVIKAIGTGHIRLGKDVGWLYCLNTFGGVLGAAAGGFFLLPLLEAQRAILLLGGLTAAAGAAVLLASPASNAAWRWGGAVLCAALLAAAAWRAPDDVSRALTVGYVPGDHHILHFDEGIEGTVVVSEPIGAVDGRDRVLWINRVQATASIEKGVKMNRLQGVLPLLFDRDPSSVLFMCFGSGITAGTLALSDFDRIDAVEISPEVLRAAPLFARDNLGVLDRPSLRFHIDDGRNFLLTARREYDVITFEPMPLALAGVSTFYTREYYALCRARLAPGGIVSQWVPMHSLNPEIVQSLIRTFIAEFPEYNAWFVNADLFLIGSDRPLRIDPERARERLAHPEIQRALAEVGFHDLEELLACFVMGRDNLRAFAGEGRIMTDDRPWAEFEAPRLVYARTVQDSIALMAPYVENPADFTVPGALGPAARDRLTRRHLARVQDLRGLRQYYGGMAVGDGVVDAFLESLEIDPKNENARYYLREIVPVQTDLYLRWGEYDTLIQLLERTLPVLGDMGPELQSALEHARAAQAES